MMEQGAAIRNADGNVDIQNGALFKGNMANVGRSYHAFTLHAFTLLVQAWEEGSRQTCRGSSRTLLTVI